MSILRKRSTGKSVTEMGGGSFQKNPFDMGFKELSIGQSLIFRVLSLDPDETRELKGFKAKIFRNTEKYKGWLDVPILKLIQKGGGEDGVEPTLINEIPDEVFKLLQDHEDNYVINNKFTSIYRIPVWVLDKVGSKKDDVEEVNALRFMEVSWSQLRKLVELQSQQQGALVFDEETKLPHYNIALRVVKGDNGNKNYRFEGLMGSPRSPDPAYGVSNYDLLEEFEDEIDNEWDNLQKAMDEFPSLDNVRYQLGGNPNKSDNGGNESLSNGRGLKSKPEIDLDEEEYTEDMESIETEVASVSAETPRFGSRRRR